MLACFCRFHWSLFLIIKKGQTNCTTCPFGTFQDGTGNPTYCKDCSVSGYNSSLGCPPPPPQNITSGFSSPSAIILIILACLLILICFLVLVVFVWKRDTPVVKSASPLFCYLILVGLMIGSASVFSLVGAPSDSVCAARPFLMALALSFVLGNLFLKTWRVYRIFG